MSDFEAIPIDDLSREDWLALRRDYIGGSDAASVVGVSPWRSPYGLALDKLGVLPVETETSEAMELGNHFERTVAEYTLRKLNEVDPGWTLDLSCKASMYVSTLHPFAAVNLDGVLTAPDGRTWGYEGKLTNTITLRKDWGGGRVPAHYELQVIHAMAVRPDLVGFVVAASAGTAYEYAFVERDDAAIARLMEHEAAFRAMLDRGEVPAPSGSEQDTDILAMLHPDATGEVTLPDEFADVAAEYLASKEAAKVADKSRRECANRLREALGDAALGRAGDYTIRRVVSDVPEHLVKASHRDYLTIR